MAFFRFYNGLLATHPYKTNMVCTGIFFGTGDCVAQYFFPHRDHEHGDIVTGYNWQRTVRAWTYGTFFFAPCAVLWYGKTLPKIKNPFLSAQRRAKMSEKRETMADVVFRVALDQMFVPALVWIPMYNTVMLTLAMHEHPLDVAMDKLNRNWWTVLKANWTVWPAFQLVLFLFIPVHLRVVCANLYSVCWNCFLSFVHNTPGHGKGTDHRIEALVDIEDEAQEVTMVYS
jgi:protein Mpv17